MVADVQLHVYKFSVDYYYLVLQVWHAGNFSEASQVWRLDLRRLSNSQNDVDLEFDWLVTGMTAAKPLTLQVCLAWWWTVELQESVWLR